MTSSRGKPRFPSDLIEDELAQYGYSSNEEEAEADKERRKSLQDIRNDFRHVFGTPQGDRCLTYLYNMCNQGVTTFSGSSQDMIYKEGMRRVYLQIAGFVQMTDERIYDLTQSQTKERQNQ